MEQSAFHDHSTIWGRLALYSRRIGWQWIFSGVAVCSVLTFWAVDMLRALLAMKVAGLLLLRKRFIRAVGGEWGQQFTYLVGGRPASEVALSKGNWSGARGGSALSLSAGAGVAGENVGGSFSNGIYSFRGSPSADTVFQGFPPDLNGAEIEHVILRQVHIDGLILTRSLEPLKNLKSIDIEALGIVGSSGESFTGVAAGTDKFLRVHLPLLSEFKFNYLASVNADVFKYPEILHKLLFFDKIPSQNWEFERDVLNVGVKIYVMIDGTVLLDINRARGVINLNVHFCQGILKNSQGPYSNLTLSWCPFTFGSSFVHPAVKYLNLNNALLSPPEFSRLLASLHSLEQLHAFQPLLSSDDQVAPFYVTPEDPFFQIPINLNDLSHNTRVLSLSRLALVVNEDEKETKSNSDPGFVSSIQDLSLEESNVTAAVLDNFPSIFPNLVTVRLFGLKELAGVEQGTPAKLLYQVLQTPAVKIVVTEYSRISGSGSEATNYSVLVEQFLTGHNLDADQESFLILRNNTPDSSYRFHLLNSTAPQSDGRSVYGMDGTMVRSLTDVEKHYKRFESMGFKDIDTFEDYLINDSIGANHNGAPGQLRSNSSLYSIPLLYFYFRHLFHF